MKTAKDVAEWMVAELEKSIFLYQEIAVMQIVLMFGREFVYDNENGNSAIDKKVLKEFRKLTEGKVVWDRNDKSWRLLSKG